MKSLSEAQPPRKDQTTLPMHKYLKSYIIAAAAFLSAAVLCSAVPSRPSPQRLVNDFAGIFSPRQVAVLENTLVAFDDSTSNQITVVTVNDLEGYSAMEYATRIGLDWEVGTSGFDNGIVLLVKPKTPESNGQTAISVGYGLEGAIPDVYCKRIIDNEMIPYFAAGDYYSGTVAGCRVLMKLASGEISEPREDRSEFSLFGLLVLFIIFSIIFFAILGRGDRGGKGGRNGGAGGIDADDIMRGILIGNILGGGRHRGGFGGNSGGFGGGFDGGGFSGGGFGGFGGGDFGGGGASGRW